MNNLNHMIWDNDKLEYIGTLVDGRHIHVSGDVWSEALDDGASEVELLLPSTWENCQDSYQVYIEE